MKYHTLGSSSVSVENRASGFTLYADMGLSSTSESTKVTYTEADMKTIRQQLEIVQRDLKLQTKRCRQLVAEYTRKLREKEELYANEKNLRDTQLAKVLKALLIFEARLKQEQKLISHQLNEKDYIIKNQKNDIRKLLASQYCKNCNQYYTSSVVSFDSSQEYQSSNFESLDSSIETYAPSERDSDAYERVSVNKNRRKLNNRKSNGTYFEVLKLRNDSPMSNDETSVDYDQQDMESVNEKIHVVSENIEAILNQSEECDKTVIDHESETNKLTETMPVFESTSEGNDNWYASASDQEDDDHRDMYRNNPVLECMNQILLQNINDINSPPKTPNIERKNAKNKRVKFSDEENHDPSEDYYEIPIQKTPNFYETPQSIYSNDYEQILSKCSETSSVTSKTDSPSKDQKNDSSHYIEMEKEDATAMRKNKILRVPPALPPKPPNLVSKCKIQILPKKAPSETSRSSDQEPDYCSISELNLPVMGKKISVVAEIHTPTVNEVKKNNVKKAPEESVNLVVKKCVDKLNIQVAKNTIVKTDASPKKKNEVQIPKLPQVSEIIIPDDPESNDEDMVSQDNYVKNNTQILQEKRDPRKPIQIGSSVSSLISGFNNHHILDEIKKKHEKMKPETKKMFSSFENLQNLDKHFAAESTVKTTFENFDLSQNFEEFKLDDCEIEEYDVEEEIEKEKNEEAVQDTRIEYIRATDKTPSLNQTSVELLKKQLEMQRSRNDDGQSKHTNQPTYEDFLECTGLSSKSILTSSRIFTNHKHMLKPKDVKLRSKVKAHVNIFEKHGNSKKYWSEPYL